MEILEPTYQALISIDSGFRPTDGSTQKFILFPRSSSVQQMWSSA